MGETQEMPVNLHDNRHTQDFSLHTSNMICQLFMTCSHSTVASATEAFLRACFLHWTVAPSSLVEGAPFAARQVLLEKRLEEVTASKNSE